MRSVLNCIGCMKKNNDPTKILNIRRSFFTVPCVGDICGTHLVFASMVAFTAMHTVAMKVSIDEYGYKCQNHAIGASNAINCNLSWFLYGPNQVSFLVWVYCILALVNMFVYSKKDFFTTVPCSINVEGAIYTMCLPYAVIALIAFYAELKGHIQPTYIQADKITATATMLYAALFRFIEFELVDFWMSFMFLLLHAIYVGIAYSATGFYVYEFAQTLSTSMILLSFFGYAILLFVFCVVFTFIHLVKVKVFAGGSLMTSNIAATPIDQCDPDFTAEMTTTTNDDFADFEANRSDNEFRG